VKSLVSKDDTFDPPAQLQAWREQGADSIDPVRFQLIDALARRAPAYTGVARQVLDARLGDLLRAYASDLAKAGGADAGQGDVETVAGTGLRELASVLAEQSPARKPEAMAGNMPLSGASYPELAAIDFFRSTWTRLSTNRQLRQSQEQVPDNAGPLHSSSIVNRSLSLMRELSPGYLEHFLAHLDALSWMDQLNTAATSKENSHRANAAKKGSRGK
jgi:hypothetical protein